MEPLRDKNGDRLYLLNGLHLFFRGQHMIRILAVYCLVLCLVRIQGLVRVDFVTCEAAYSRLAINFSGYVELVIGEFAIPARHREDINCEAIILAQVAQTGALFERTSHQIVKRTGLEEIANDWWVIPDHLGV